MKKTIYLICALFIINEGYSQTIFNMKGQVMENRVFENCEGSISSIDDLLAEGKPLIIFASAVDCGYCFEEAPEVSANIIKTKDKINWLFALLPQNNRPTCNPTNAGDHDWPGDWVSRYPGYANAKIIVQPGGDGYYLIDCGVTTSFGSIDPISKKIIGSGCRHDGMGRAMDAALKLYTDGILTKFDKTVEKPTISETKNGSSSAIVLKTATANANIYYTLDGTTPSKKSIKYENSFTVTNPGLVKAIAYKDGMNNSQVANLMRKTPNALLTNIAPSGSGFQWVGNVNKFSNGNKSALAGVNNGTMDDVSLNGAKDDKANAFQSFGVIWDNIKTGITSIKLTNCTPPTSGWGSKNYFALNMTLQSTEDGITWKDVQNFGHYPEYPYGRLQEYQIKDPVIFFTDKPISAKGIRITGMVNVQSNDGAGNAKYSGLKELQIYQTNTVTGTEENLSENGILLYPNPANDLLHINLLDASFEEYSIIDMKGITRIKSKIKSATEVINTSELESGIYVFSAKGAKNFVQKLVIE